MFLPLLAQNLHSSSTRSSSAASARKARRFKLTLTVGSVESSRTCTMTLSDGHDSPHAAPIESLYTSRSLYMGIWTSTMG
uniref:Uncharacterized protein n=1 Tax=Arundo donax TaxID=35708 RepID=A0A0A9DSI2_ARUDO